MRIGCFIVELTRIPAALRAGLPRLRRRLTVQGNKHAERIEQIDGDRNERRRSRAGLEIQNKAKYGQGEVHDRQRPGSLPARRTLRRKHECQAEQDRDEAGCQLAPPSVRPCRDGQQIKDAEDEFDQRISLQAFSRCRHGIHALFLHKWFLLEPVKNRPEFSLRPVRCFMPDGPFP